MTEQYRIKLNDAAGELSAVIKGKDEVVEMLVIAVLAGGHVLLEDKPGVGKTTLAKALARTLDLEFSRIQFTPDLLPSDLLGMSVLNPKDGSFTFLKGPVFANLLLADEINRASPRTQSALLEAMNESQVSIDNETRELSQPFFVIATQNPVEYQGTYPLPEAQLDRFLIKLSLGYPDEDQELQLLFDRKERDPLDAVKMILSSKELLDIQRAVRTIDVEKDVARYMIRIIEDTRTNAELEMGASPRASLALFRACQARAFLQERSFVTPQDVQHMVRPVIEHRVSLTSGAKYGGTTVASILSEIIERQKVPV